MENLHGAQSTLSVNWTHVVVVMVYVDVYVDVDALWSCEVMWFSVLLEKEVICMIKYGK